MSRYRTAGGPLGRLTRTVAVGAVAILAPSVAATQVQDTGAVLTLHSECTACHPRAHDAVLGQGPPASAKCGACHPTVHDPIQALYAGKSDRATLHPDVMFAARVQCAECHTVAALAATPGAARLAAIDRACTSCHGTRFTGMLARWSAGMTWRTRVVSEYVTRAAADRRLAASASARVRGAQQALAEVTTAGGLHNVRGADALLRSALAGAVAAYGEAGLIAPSRPALGPDPAHLSCMGCHYGIEAARGSAFGRPFDHQAHVVGAGIACQSCHSSADYFLPGKHEVDPRHGKTTLTATSCDGCHHAPASTLACAACHAGSTAPARDIRVTLPLHLTAKGAPTARAVVFRHLDHTNAACASCHTSRPTMSSVAACATCHEAHHRQAAQCSACHGTEVHAAHTAADHLACARCHNRETVALLTPDRTFCITCHADHANHKTGRECSTCHMQSTPAELRQRILTAPR